ncbi:MAG: Sec-independent protein translocase subunit TatA/TatB [Alphaproteobacteria bacterium]
MFDLGSWGEFLIIVMAALILLGPKELPVVMRTLGRWVYKVRRITSHYREHLDDLVFEAEREDIMKSSAQESSADDKHST